MKEARMKIREDVRNYLQKWYNTSSKTQAKNQVDFQLTFDEFLSLWGQRRINKLTEWYDARSLGFHLDKANPYAYVLTWRSYAARSTKVMSIHTAQVCTRMKSQQDNKIKKGDKLTLEHRQRMSEAKLGIARDEGTKRAISDALKGRKRGPMSPEQKAKIAASVKARKAGK